MKKITTIILFSLLAICLWGVIPASTPVHAQSGTTHYYLPLIGKQLAINPTKNKIAVGGDFACAATPSGGVKCWGNNEYGQLGDGTRDPRSGKVNVINLGAQVTALAANYNYICALTVNGGVKCWGKNESGQLGDGTRVTRYAPVDVVGLTSGVKAISTGSNYTCALTVSGAVKCWGSNFYGQLGDGTTTDHNSPVSVSGLASGVREIAAGGEHACVITEAGGVKCWGNNEHGGLGVTGKTQSAIPVDVPGLEGVLSIAAGASTCIITSTNEVKCWGYTPQSDGTWVSNPTPTAVPGLANVVAITSGSSGNCALTASLDAKCWGFNQYGEVGDGTTTVRAAPVSVTGLPAGSVTGVTIRHNFACAMLTNGGLRCWGRNDAAQLGTGSNYPDHSTTPVSVTNFP